MPKWTRAIKKAELTEAVTEWLRKRDEINEGDEVVLLMPNELKAHITESEKPPNA